MMSLSRAEVRELDRRAIEEFGVPGIVLMENAGRGAAEVLMRLNPERRPVLIACGKGNNGGDGFVIARHLDLHGWPVHRIFVFCKLDELTGDAGANMRITDRSGLHPGCLGNVDIRALDSYLVQFVMFHDGWIVDSLFGTGLTGPLHEPYDRVVAAINAGPAKVLAVDIPSGLDCDTGAPLGPCVRADHTVTFVAPKAGFANPAAKLWLGEVHVVGIGAPRKLLEAYGIGVDD